MFVHAFLVVAALLGSGGRLHSCTTDRADMCEVNFKYDEGKLSFIQIIYYEWDAHWNRYHVISWHIAEKIEQYPTLMSNGRYLSIKREGNKEIHIWSDSMRISWTAEDPERLNRKLFDEKYRRGIGRASR